MDYEVMKYHQAGGMMLTTCKECGQQAKVIELGPEKAADAEFECCGKVFSLMLKPRGNQ